MTKQLLLSVVVLFAVLAMLGRAEPNPPGPPSLKGRGEQERTGSDQQPGAAHPNSPFPLGKGVGGLGSSSAFAGEQAEGRKQVPEPQRYHFTQPHMGTEFRLTFYAPSEEVARKAAAAAFARVAELDLIMSDYKATSELMQLCRKAGGAPVRISDDLFTILEKSLEFSRASDGAFDVTVGPIVRLWRKARRTRQLPDPQDLKEALAKVGYHKLKLDSQKRTVQLLIVGMLLDLGGIAKGYAADAILAVLRRFGIRQALVAAGGDIVAADAPPGAKGWKVGIGPLKNPTAKPEHYLLLVNAATSTSGDVEQYALIDEKRYSHIVDPKSGIGLLGRSSVTVVARDSTTADALATTVSVLGPKLGLELIEKTSGAACLFVRENQQGTLERFVSKRWADYRYPEKK